ncbi:hypothetical protein EV426DRAFT_717718 [Tirmania nivea]|nr:hypothetical protein EV426DRAFT_717718 [Tirmania nivea]
MTVAAIREAILREERQILLKKDKKPLATPPNIDISTSSSFISQVQQNTPLPKCPTCGRKSHMEKECWHKYPQKAPKWWKNRDNTVEEDGKSKKLERNDRYSASKNTQRSKRRKRELSTSSSSSSDSDTDIPNERKKKGKKDKRKKENKKEKTIKKENKRATLMVEIIPC